MWFDCYAIKSCTCGIYITFSFQLPVLPRNVQVLAAERRTPPFVYIKQQYTWNVLWMYNLYCETSNLFFSVSSSTMECSSFCCCECNSSACLSNNNHVHEMIICTPSVLWNNFKSHFFLTCWTFVSRLLAYNCLFTILISYSRKLLVLKKYRFLYTSSWAL